MKSNENKRVSAHEVGKNVEHSVYWIAFEQRGPWNSRYRHYSLCVLFLHHFTHILISRDYTKFASTNNLCSGRTTLTALKKPNHCRWSGIEQGLQSNEFLFVIWCSFGFFSQRFFLVLVTCPICPLLFL